MAIRPTKSGWGLPWAFRSAPRSRRVVKIRRVAETSTMHTMKTPSALSILTIVALMRLADGAQAQTRAVYCDDLKRVIALTTTKDHFVSITGKPREGNFSDTTLALTGWKDCSL